MSVDKFHFPTMAELRAFETGVWFSEVPVTTLGVGVTLMVSDTFGSGVSEHEYDPVETTFPLNDLGDRILANHIRFSSATEATAFAAGLDWFGGAFANIDLRGMDVVVCQTRPDNQNDEMLTYEYNVLRGLIADNRVQTQPTSSPASA